MKKTTTIVFMGDSITAGQYIHHSLRWTELVASALRGNLFKTSTDYDLYHFFNRAVSGETTRQGLERFPRDVQVLEPDIITLQFGLNDCNCWESDRGLPRVSPAAYRANLIEMIDRARKFGTKQIILSTNHPTLVIKPFVSAESFEDRRHMYNKIVRDVAVETGVILCDIDEDFSGLPSYELADLLLPEPDLLHLSEYGHARYFKAIFTPIINAFNLIKEV
jgi:lysophospholipase L1-like esterase